MAVKLNKHGDKMEIDMDMLIDGDSIPVIVSINRGVLAIRVKGQRKRALMAEWKHVISKMPLSADAPGKYFQRTVEFMKGE